MHRLEFMIIMYCPEANCSSKNDLTIITLTGTNDLGLYKRAVLGYGSVDRNFIGWQKRFIEFETNKQGNIQVNLRANKIYVKIKILYIKF